LYFQFEHTEQNNMLLLLFRGLELFDMSAWSMKYDDIDDADDGYVVDWCW